MRSRARFFVFNSCRAALTVLAVSAAAAAAPAAEFALMRGGQPACSIVVAAEAGPVEQHAAAELAAYLGKIAGGPAPAVGAAPAEGLYPVTLAVDARADLDEEGFVLKAGPDGLRIVGRQPIGVLYGAYEILKTCGGVRWITPGADGEYFSVKPTIAVPQQDSRHEPAFRWRRLFFGSCNANSFLSDTWDWMVRNNLRPTISRRGTHDAPKLRDFLEARGALGDEIGCFSRLLAGIYVDRSNQEGYAHLAGMFQDHPERFPLITGKRIPLTGDQRYQPCTSNPDVIALMRATADAFLSQRMRAGDEFTLFNDDGTGWCQCPYCAALDPPEEKELRFVSTRFWIFANVLLGPLVDRHPDIKLGAIAYQNFQRAPVGVTPDPRLYVHKAYNRRCYRHALDDPDCPVNRVFHEYFQEWSRLGNASYTWDQVDASAMKYMPTEHTFINQLKAFHELGVNGARPVVSPPDGTYGPRYDGTLTSNCWYGMWQTLYLSAQFHWNLDRDYDALAEEAGALYYGPAWPAMRAYHAARVAAATNDPGCVGWGPGAPVGRLLTQPGVHDKLKALLAEAETAAQADPRAARHVKRDRTFFTQVWEAGLKTWQDNYRELRLYRRAAPIAVDGALDEPDWKNADIITGFKSVRAGAPAEIAQTFVKAVYEPDNLYFGIEAMEPAPGSMVTEIRKRDGALWLDNTLEIFITHPDLDRNYFHLIFNADGVLYDAFNRSGQKAADLGFDSRAEVRTRVLDDRWVAEVRIPTAPLGMQAFDGQVWRINVARGRVLKDDTRETSSWAGGAFHGVDYYPTVTFSGAREIRALSFEPIDTRIWKNSGFNEAVKRDPQHGSASNWTLGANGLLPKDWHLQGLRGDTGELEMVDLGAGNRALRLKRGAVFQMNHGMERDYAVTLRLKGQGLLRVMIYNYPRLGTGNEIDQDARRRGGGLPTRLLGEVRVDSGAWQTHRFAFRKADPLHISALALAIQEGDVMIDEAFMLPAPDPKAQ